MLIGNVLAIISVDNKALLKGFRSVSTMNAKISTLVLILLAKAEGGRPKAKEEEGGRIYNGKLAEEGEFPFMVSIFRFNEFYCGASMITVRTVLTAAHCVVKSMNPPTEEPFNPATFKIGYGSVDLTKIRKLKVVKVIVKDNPMRADVAVLWTKVDIPVNVTTIALPMESSDFAGGTKIQLVGWGDLNSAEETNLLHTTTSVLTDDVSKCLAREDEATFKQNRLCGEKINGTGACRGDSGGPVIVSVNGEPLLIGINSYLREACDTIPPSHGMIFVKISSYTSWLYNVSTGGTPQIVEP